MNEESSKTTAEREGEKIAEIEAALKLVTAYIVDAMRKGKSYDAATEDDGTERALRFLEAAASELDAIRAES